MRGKLTSKRMVKILEEFIQEEKEGAERYEKMLSVLQDHRPRGVAEKMVVKEFEDALRKAMIDEEIHASNFQDVLVRLHYKIQGNPAYTERQRRFACAELGRKRRGKRTVTGMAERQLRDYCRKNPVTTRRAQYRHRLKPAVLERGGSWFAYLPGYGFFGPFESQRVAELELNRIKEYYGYRP